MTLTDAAEIIRLNQEQDRTARAAARAYAAGMRDGDFQRAAEAAEVIESTCSWRLALAACSRLDHVHPEAQERFVEVWCKVGDTLRQEVGDDRVLLAALRVLLPRYTGPVVTLYRGETASACRRRAYGPCWTADRVVAESHALNRQDVPGGAVILKTEAPPAAIIAAPALLTDTWGEQEYLVNRRKLSAVEVVARFPGHGTTS